MLAEIEAAEARKKAIEDLYCSPGFFERTDSARGAALEQEKVALQARIEALVAQWETLEQQIDALERD